jgi:phosphate transport system permease protein
MAVSNPSGENVYSMPARTLERLPTNPKRLARRKRRSAIFAFVCGSVMVGALMVLAYLLYGILRDGLPMLSTKFLTSMPSYRPANAGVKPALYGSLWLLGITVAFAVPVGVGAAIFLEEYAGSNRFTRFVQINIANLAAVPSVIYGILALTVFVRLFKMGSSVLAGGLTLGLLILPVIIIASQEALRAVPGSLRQGSYALGATRWQTIWKQVLPVALPGILTGVILAVSRAVGEAAPLLIMGALAYVAFVPSGPTDEFTALPIQIYNWASMPKEEFKQLSASGIIILMAVLLSMNTIAILLRNKYNNRL